MFVIQHLQQFSKNFVENVFIKVFFYFYWNAYYIYRVSRPNQECHCTEGHSLVNHIKGKSHQAQLNKR